MGDIFDFFERVQHSEQVTMLTDYLLFNNNVQTRGLPSAGSKSQEAEVQLPTKGPLKTNFLDITLIYLFDMFCRVDILNKLKNTKFKFHKLVGKL